MALQNWLAHPPYPIFGQSWRDEKEGPPASVCSPRAAGGPSDAPANTCELNKKILHHKLNKKRVV